jgi:hypothetical protein
MAQVLRSLSRGNTNERDHAQSQGAAIYALAGIGPKDELEGMIAAQLVASHNAAMECHRRANSDQTFEGRKEHLNQANKLSRTFATLLEGLNRHRGKGQQKMTVEHVHVHEGGQAIVGNNPKDELEGMIAAQLVASHNAAMECHRRATNDQTFEGRKENLNQANKSDSRIAGI